MRKRKERSLSRIAERDPALRAGREAVRKAIAWHMKIGNPVVYRKNGQMVYLYPDGRELPVTPARTRALAKLRCGPP